MIRTVSGLYKQVISMCTTGKTKYTSWRYLSMDNSIYWFEISTGCNSTKFIVKYKYENEGCSVLPMWQKKVDKYEIT